MYQSRRNFGTAGRSMSRTGAKMSAAIKRFSAADTCSGATAKTKPPPLPSSEFV